MLQVKLTEKAESDLDGIHEHYAAKVGESRASQMVLGIVQALEQLRMFPGSGRPGEYPDTRELVISTLPYVAVYGVKDSQVRVYRVLPQRGERSQYLADG